MAQPNALIVDDSKTAQFQLKKLLDQYNLQIDTALSAEEALAHLEHTHPNVIFLDHHMTGMDGLSALKIIKENPETAVIPVIMYTSEKGQLYVGQARALGALDILTKSEIHPSSLERVLKNLKIEPTGEQAPQLDASNDSGAEAKEKPSAVSATKPSTAPKKKQTPKKQDLVELTVALEKTRSQLDRSIQQQTDDIRAQLTKQAQTTADYIKKNAEQNCQQLDTVKSDIDQKLAAYSVLLKKGSLIGLAGLLAGLVIGGSFLAAKSQQNTAEIQQALSAISTELEGLKQNTNANQLNPQPLSSQNEDLTTTANSFPVEAFDWAINTDLRFHYREQPLGEQQVGKITQLIDTLRQANYQGTVELDLQFGNLRLKPDNNNVLTLAAPLSPFGDCTMLAATAPTFNLNNYLSIAYLDLQDSLQGSGIDLELSTSGLTTPGVTYPQTAATAGEWNAIALQNNRITVSFIADSITE